MLIYNAITTSFYPGTGIFKPVPFSLVLRDEASVLIAFAVSFIRIWCVFVLCVVVGVPLGIIISLKMKLYDTVSPVLEVISSIPAPALLPLIVALCMGSGELVAATIIFIAMIWYIIFDVMAGLRTLPADYLDLAKILHVSRREAWFDIYIPSVMTAFVTGSITAIGAAWNSLIVAEYFSTGPLSSPMTQVKTGIGKTITIATKHGDLLVLTLSIVTMTLLILVFNLTVWRRVYNHATKKYTYNR